MAAKCQKSIMGAQSRGLSLYRPESSDAFTGRTQEAFHNKMDQNGTEKEKLMKELKKQLDDGCIEFGQGDGVTEDFNEQLAMCDEGLMDAYLESYFDCSFNLVA